MTGFRFWREFSAIFESYCLIENVTDIFTIDIVNFFLLLFIYSSIHSFIVFNYRYNITTDDYDPVNTDSRFNDDL